MPSAVEAVKVQAKSIGSGQIPVGMGQIAVARQPARLIAVLGSCVGVAIYDPRSQRGGLAHVVLPDSRGHVGNPGKFANTAVPYLFDLFASHGAQPSELLVWVVGGSCMFDANGPMQIGEANIKAVLSALEAAGARPNGKDVGGTNGRRVALDCAAGKLTVEIGGKVARTL
jgi:chemotaxis protein CheD